MEHWLDAQVTRLRALAEDAAPRRGPGMTRSDDPRRALLAAVRELVEQVVTRAGVSACVACYEGLPVAAAGQAAPAQVEAVSAMAQRLVDAGGSAAAALGLGAPRQVVVVGAQHKLALIVLGALAVAIVAPVETPLGGALAR